MYFNMKRYYYGIIKRRYLFLLMVIIPLLYVGISAVIPDRFQISQNIILSDDTPVALLSNPVGYMPFGDLRVDQKEFFVNAYTMNKIRNELVPFRGESLDMVVIQEIQSNIAILKEGDNLFKIEYSGKYRQIGEALVAFYSERLEKIALEGKVRSNNNGGAGIKPELSGIVEVNELKALWRPDRWLPLIISIVGAFSAVILIIGLLEWNDSSFKSERQIARYTGLPILGNVPDLNKVSQRIQSDTTTVT